MYVSCMFMAFLPVRFSASETVISIFFAKQSSIFSEEENKDSCNISHAGQRLLLALPSLLPHHIHSNKTALYRIKALAGFHFILMFCITFVNENRKPALGEKNPKSTNRHLGIPKAITRGEDIEKEKYFSFPGNKVTFLKNKPTNQP